MIIYREDENKRAIATPKEEAEHIKALSEMILGALYSEGALSGKELKNRYGRAWHSTGNYSNKIIDMVLFAHPNIAKIGNTKSRLYYYTEEMKEALPWW